MSASNTIPWNHKAKMGLGQQQRLDPAKHDTASPTPTLHLTNPKQPALKSYLPYKGNTSFNVQTRDSRTICYSQDTCRHLKVSLRSKTTGHLTSLADTEVRPAQDNAPHLPHSHLISCIRLEKSFPLRRFLQSFFKCPSLKIGKNSFCWLLSL